MKNKIQFLALLLSLVTTQVVYAQSNPVGWRITIKDGMNDSIKEVHLDANIDDGWQLYSNDFSPNLGPMRAEFMFVKRQEFDLIGGTIPMGSKRKYDDIWGGEYAYFEKKALFVQQIASKVPEPPVECRLSYQVCNTKDGKCIPFETTLKINTEH